MARISSTPGIHHARFVSYAVRRRHRSGGAYAESPGDGRAPPATNNNVTAPADDPGWLNVGDNGVYLGNRWVLTASHVGAGPIVFADVGTFGAVPGSEVRLHSPTDSSAPTDLLLFRLAADPGLPALRIATSTVPAGDLVMYIGDGAEVTPSAMETHWQVVQTSSNPNRYSWTEVSSGGNAHGYLETTGGQKMWGTNRVDLDHTVPISTGSGVVITLYTDFDRPGVLNSEATPSEAQGLAGDSGSAAFHKNGSTWELAGLIHAIGTFTDQPFGAEGLSAVYGNLTYFADLSAYESQITAVTGIPEASGWLLLGVATIAAGMPRLLTKQKALSPPREFRGPRRKNGTHVHGDREFTAP